MCGIFGFVRHLGAPCPEQVTATFAHLGHMSQERGTDASGFAAIYPAGAPKGPTTLAESVMAKSPAWHADTVAVRKDCDSFARFWDPNEHVPLLTSARAAIGHTRWATQGSRGDLVNASPLRTGRVVGTHNGDVTKTTLPFHTNLIGATDTEKLYRAINAHKSHRGRIAKLLSSMEGRAALAWHDVAHPDRLYLARAGLSPLAVGYDQHGNFYWASNPRWFDEATQEFDGAVVFSDVTLVAEGSLLTVDMSQEAPVVADTRSFVPTVRSKDLGLAFAVWRGFTKEDEALDRAQLVHSVAAPPVRTPPKSHTWSWTGKDSSSAKDSGTGEGSLSSRLEAEEADVFEDSADWNDWQEHDIYIDYDGITCDDAVDIFIHGAIMDRDATFELLLATGDTERYDLAKQYGFQGVSEFTDFQIVLFEYAMNGDLPFLSEKDVDELQNALSDAAIV
jgi:glutamine---fructose-6-phosphate transaminase (isomerizing)